MRASGRMINNTGTALSPGQTVLDMKASMKTERKKDKADSHLLMAVITKDNFRRTRFQVLEITTGLMENRMQATGVRTKWTVMECSLGKTAKSTRATS